MNPKPVICTPARLQWKVAALGFKRNETLWAEMLRSGRCGALEDAEWKMRAGRSRPGKERTFGAARMPAG